MRVFAAGISTETNTFSPIPTGLDDFAVHRGSDLRTGRATRSIFDLAQIWGPQAKSRGDEFVYSLMAFAEPAGLTTTAAYESLRDEVLADLRASMPVDVVLLMLHGAMIAQGYEDCEEDIIRCVRDIVGSQTVIAVELDLHCHLRLAKIAAADVVVLYKEYPHEDAADRGHELFDLAVRTRQGSIRPRMALFDCRMIGMYPTTRSPLREFVSAMREAESRDQVLSISFGHGFPFADVPHMGSKILAVTNDNPALAAEVAREFGLKACALRRQIGFDTFSLPMEEALSKALVSPRTPVVVADQSDNPGGGAPGDATYALRWLLDHGAEDVALAIFYDPEVVRIAKKAGRGARLSVRLGGKLGPSSGAPVDMDVTVVSVLENYIHEFPQRSGRPMLFPLGDIAAIRCGTIDIVVGSERCQCFSPKILSDLGIDPGQKRLLIAKSTQHFYGAFAPVAAEIFYMTAPGAVPPNPRLIPYRHLDTGSMYPWVEDPLNQDGS